MERFFSGYCRVLDQSRMVAVETEDGALCADCDYAVCPYAAACPIGTQIACLEKEENA